jgi:hypothetical protein
MKFTPYRHRSELGRCGKSVCFGGGKMIALVLSALVLVLTFLNTVSARYLDPPCRLMNRDAAVQAADSQARTEVNQCVALGAELATRLHTHG